MKMLIAALMLSVGCASIGRGHRSEGARSFSVVVEPTARGWSVSCEHGCKWGIAAFQCPSECGAIIDQNGIALASTTRTAPATFSFEVERTADGARAVSRGGTTWTSVSWSCKLGDCTARIDASGVSTGL